MHYNQKNKQTGFTIIELMLVVLVGGIIMAIALPNFRGMQRNSCMTTSSNQLVVSFNLARSEAAKLNSEINITATNSTNTSNEWGSGWTVWNDIDDDNTLDTDETIYRGQIDCTSIVMNDTSNISTYVFTPDGFIDTAATVQVCDSDNSIAGERGRVISVSVTGRPSVDSFTCS